VINNMKLTLISHMPKEKFGGSQPLEATL